MDFLPTNNTHKYNTISLQNTMSPIQSRNSADKVIAAHKLVRRIETQHTKIETIEEDEDGNEIIKVDDKEVIK